MEHGSSPTKYPGRTAAAPSRPGRLCSSPTIWMGVRPGELVGLQPCSITLWWLVRVRPAPPRSRALQENSFLEPRSQRVRAAHRSKPYPEWVGDCEPTS